jgi:hypothetical protein
MFLFPLPLIRFPFFGVFTPCGFPSPTQVAAACGGLMKFDRKFARQMQFMQHPFFRLIAWIHGRFVPQQKGFRKFKRGDEIDPHIEAQFAEVEKNELIELCKAIEEIQGMARDEPEIHMANSQVEGPAEESPTSPEFPGIDLLIGGTWAIESIEQLPTVRLDDWQCFELKMERRPGRSRHLVGSAGRDRHGQVSSAIFTIDPGIRKCTTKSGRVYELGARNGLTGDGDYTWRQWIRINQASGIVDVTAEIKKLLAGPA